MRLIRVLLVAVMLLQPFAAPAVERSLFQYTHQRWSEKSDASRHIVALAQGQRGYLWAATALGLFRFDGIRFEPISAGVDLVVHGPPSALLVRRNGDIWTNFERSRRFAVYRNGRLRFLRAPPAPHRVMTMHETRDGTIWVLTEQIGTPLMRFRDGVWTSFGTAAGAPLDNPFSMVVTSDGVVWLSFSGSVARLLPGSRRIQLVRHARGSIGRLSIDPEERIWLTERRGTYPLTGPGGRGRPPPLRHAYATDAAQIRGWPGFDRQGNLWIATYYDGVQRVARPDPRGAASPAESASRVERFAARDGLSSNATSQVFQDAEGNVWVATENGLDRFWPATIRFEAELTKTAAFGDLLLTASDGTVYIGQASTVYRVRPGGRPEPIFRTKVEPRTLCEAPDGAIWIGTNDRNVVIWRDGVVRGLGQTAPVNSTIYDCAFDASGDYWVTASYGGMARYRKGRWERMFGQPGEAFLPKSMVTDARGRLVFQWNDRILARLDGGARSATTLPLGGYDPDETALYPVPPNTLFAAGRFGLARLRDGRFHAISPRRVPMFSGLSGMVQTPAGDTWLAGPEGIVRMTSAELERALSDPGHIPSLQVFGASDGLKSRPHSHSRRSIVRGGDGRLWIATQTGTLWLDPTQIVRNSRPPPVAIRSVTAGRQFYRDPTSLALAAGTSNIEIDFAVLSFADPQQVSVRYRLEGYDQGWIDPGTRRQAFYTNLPPGHYRFQVIAANQAGVWNRTGAAVDFELPPTFFQSRWFFALCLMVALALLWLGYRLRVAQVGRQIKSRLEERLSERERIARELHDTLLQSVQGLVLRFQSVANKMPAEGLARAHLESALERADEVIAEGRNRVQDLRKADREVNLPELLQERAVAAGFDPSIPIRIVVEGQPRPIDPLVSVEIGQIAGEALFNAARYARASAVEITIRFAAWQLGVEVSDDGVGIAPAVLENGHKPGHFGLIGMRERAERIGGSFSIDSRIAMGTTVTITLPAALAFANQAPRRRLFSRLFRRHKDPSRV
jgi:signal transduction histidine kinase/ligand-binding sensor domain-containing protein